MRLDQADRRRLPRRRSRKPQDPARAPAGDGGEPESTRSPAEAGPKSGRKRPKRGKPTLAESRDPREVFLHATRGSLVDRVDKPPIGGFLRSARRQLFDEPAGTAEMTTNACATGHSSVMVTSIRASLPGGVIAARRASAPPVNCMVGRPEARLTTPMSRQNTPLRMPVPSALAQASLAAKRLA